MNGYESLSSSESDLIWERNRVHESEMQPEPEPEEAPTDEDGFTLVELVGAIFIGSFLTLWIIVLAHFIIKYW